MRNTTNAELASLVRTLELKLEEQAAQLAALAVPTAQQSMAAIASTLTPVCEACEGTGLHSSGGDCFRCKAKGWQDVSDLARNAAYDRVRVKRTDIAGREGYASLAAIPLELKRSASVHRIDGLYYVTPRE